MKIKLAGEPEANPVPTKKRKKTDGTYSKRSNKKSKPNSKLNAKPSLMRSDHESSFETTDDEHEDLKTAVLVNVAAIESPQAPFTPERIIRQLDFSSIPSNRPIQKQINKIIESPNGTKYPGSPISVITPNGSKLNLTTNLGMVREFSNKTRRIKQPNFDLAMTDNLIQQPSSQFFNSDQFKCIHKMLDGITHKEQELHLTEALLKQCKIEHEMNNKHRVISQNAVMVEKGFNPKFGSAKNYAKATTAYQLFETNWQSHPMEWLHLIAYQFKGNAAQTTNNLVLGSAYTNTEMMNVEEQAKRLAKLYPDGITISVYADIIENTHIAKRIYYRLQTPDFTLEFDFLGASPNKPNASLNQYLGEVVNACLRVAEEKKKPSAPKSDNVEKSKPSVSTESIFKSPTKRPYRPAPASPTRVVKPK